jgi:hypothetical protein
MHIVSRGEKSEIMEVRVFEILITTSMHLLSFLQALHRVRLDEFFPSDRIVGWQEMRDSRLATKSDCVMQVTDNHLLR